MASHRRTWFKHFVTASEGSLQLLVDQNRQDAVFLYWIILECLAQFEDKNTPGQASIPWGTLSRLSGYNRLRLRRLCAQLDSNSLLRVEDLDGEIFTFKCAKWVELQGTWGGKRVPSGESSTGRREKREERRKKREENTPSKASLDLEFLYQQYPRKQGKHRGMKIAKAQIKTDKELEELTIAVNNYSTYCKRSVEDPKFIKHFSTFMSEWRDWIEPVNEQNRSGPRPIEEILADQGVQSEQF